MGVCAPREACAARGVEAGGAADGGRALEPLADVGQRRVDVAAVAHVPLQVGVVPGLVLARQAGRAQLGGRGGAGLRRAGGRGRWAQ